MSSNELLSAGFFFKDFENPIEREIQLTAQLRTSFINAQGAKNLGIELETRKNLAASRPLFRTSSSRPTTPWSTRRWKSPESRFRCSPT